MEIYNERIKDLLSDENTNPEIVEDRKVDYSIRSWFSLLMFGVNRKETMFVTWKKK